MCNRLAIRWVYDKVKTSSGRSLCVFNTSKAGHTFVLNAKNKSLTHNGISNGLQR